MGRAARTGAKSAGRLKASPFLQRHTLEEGPQYFGSLQYSDFFGLSGFGTLCRQMKLRSLWPEELLMELRILKVEKGQLKNGQHDRRKDARQTWCKHIPEMDSKGHIDSTNAGRSNRILGFLPSHHIGFSGLF